MSTAAVCHHHPDRGAVARCPGCGLVFCRECVVEHDGRILCASCLKATAVKAGKRESGAAIRALLGRAFLGLRFVFALLLLWFCFYATGRLLLKIPPEYHDGTVWKEALDEAFE